MHDAPVVNEQDGARSELDPELGGWLLDPPTQLLQGAVEDGELFWSDAYGRQRSTVVVVIADGKQALIPGVNIEDIVHTEKLRYTGMYTCALLSTRMY